MNGNLLSTIKGMFLQDYIDVTSFVKTDKSNALAIKVYPVDVPGSAKPKSWGAVGEFHNGGNGNIGTSLLWMAFATVIQESGRIFLSILPVKWHCVILS